MSAIDPNKASQNNSTKAFLTALVVNFGLLFVEVGAFIILKQKLWRIYSPRAYLPPPDKRAQELPSGPWRWIPALIKTPSKDIIQKNGLDAYMFIRFIKLLSKIFFVFTILTFAVIIPVDVVNIKSELEGVKKISWTNIVDPKDQQRFAAHVIVVYILTGFVIYLIYREMVHFVQLRHQFLLSHSHSRLAQSRTVLVTSVPDELGNESDLRTFASFVPGGVDKVWLYHDTKALNQLFEQRQELCTLLETAESTVLSHATKIWRKKVKAHTRANRKKANDEESNAALQLTKPTPSFALLNELVPDKHRPKHRTGLLGILGTKVDTINHCKEEIRKINVSIKELREQSPGKFLGSAFIRCNLQMGAHILTQCVSYHEPLFMYNKWMEAHPKDIVWSNLDDSALEMNGRYVASWAATFGLIIAWAFPVGFIGTVSNLSELCVEVKWLAWVCELPEVARGIIEGVLPPALLAILFALLPIILRAFAWYECIPRYSLISVSVYRRYFIFLLIHGFLIVTLSSGITNAINDLVRNPTQTVQQLATQLPGASVFFLTYMITQGLAGAGGALAQLVPLGIHYMRKWLLGRTPRQAYEVTFKMPTADLGVTLPRLSLLATITFAYSVLSPLINLLALCSFGMFYIAWKFLLIQVFDQPDEAETGGMYFPMAINNLFAGLYIEHICLACLFFLRAADEGAHAVVKAVFMLILLALTVGAHLFMSHSFNHLIHFLPMSLATKKMAKKFERQKKEKSSKGSDDDELDLFSRHRIRSVRRRIKQKVNVIKGKGRDSEEKERRSSETAVIYGVDALHKQLELSRQPSGSSQKSEKSRKSTESRKKPKVTVDAPAPALTSPSSPDDTDNDSDEDAQDDHAFDHPSTYQEQAWIWIPKDVLGLSEVIAEDLRVSGVDASDLGAYMDEHGVVEVRRNPPDEEWTGGHDD
ncbi:DUF221-domain-containing protein [Coprinopsis marcescibilis]|uniref:DUF221-domain-containing protein n=1 Tax=Coprinopsis marcescibilis TaxID=230819 RepID=A0A5C3KYA5_COPMA|nr:DUF221-domain-containing protein [Coprinopsis marcescibilis]